MFAFTYGVECIIVQSQIGSDHCLSHSRKQPIRENYRKTQVFNADLRTPWMIFFWLCDLDLWPMTLTFEHDLDIIRHDLHAKIQDCMYVCSARIVRQTDGRTDSQTDRQTQPKLLHPPLTWGVIMRQLRWFIPEYEGKTVFWSFWHFLLHYLNHIRTKESRLKTLTVLGTVKVRKCH